MLRQLGAPAGKQVAPGRTQALALSWRLAHLGFGTARLFGFFVLLLGASLVPCESAARPDVKAVGNPACPWPELSGEHLLKRPIDKLSLQDAKVELVVAKLSEKADLPMSFIQADPEVRISLDTTSTNVRGVLDLLVAKAPSYRYGVLAGRLVVYPSEPRWQTRVDDLKLGPAPRVQLAEVLAGELRKRFPSFSHLFGPWILGDPRAYTYQDLVSVAGPGSVLEIVLQLLGNRPSTFLLVVQEDGWAGSSLSASSEDQIVSLKVTAPTLSPRERGEMVQLQVVATLRGGHAKDLTANACNTIYSVSDQRVLSVSPDGLVTVRGPGDAEVTVTSERSSETLTFHVVLDKDPNPDSGQSVKPRVEPQR